MNLGPVPSPSLISFLAGMSMAPGLEWRSPDACPGEEAVVEEVRRLGVEVDEASFELHAEVETNGEGYTLDLSIRTATGTTRRQLEADSCDALVRAAALMLAVALEPFRVPPPPEPAPQDGTPKVDPPYAPPPEPRRDRLESTAPPVENDSGPAVTVALFVSGLVGRGIVPGLDGRLQLGLGVDAPWLRAELLGFHAFERDVRYDDRPEVGARIQAWGGSARVGPRFTAASLVFSCPIGVAMAGVIGEGFGTARAWQRADMHWGFVMAPGLRVSLAARLALGIDFEADVAVRRPAFSLDRLGVVHRTPRIGARGGVRLEWQFSGLLRDQPRPRRRT